MVLHVLQLAERRDVNTPVIVTQTVNMQLKKFYEERQGMNQGEPTLYSAVMYLLANLSLPIQTGLPSLPPHMMANMPGNMPGNQFMQQQIDQNPMQPGPSQMMQPGPMGN